MHESESEVAQSGPTPSNPTDFSLPGSSAHGIFQARVLEWGAIAFSGICLLNTMSLDIAEDQMPLWFLGGGRAVTSEHHQHSFTNKGPDFHIYPRLSF